MYYYFQSVKKASKVKIVALKDQSSPVFGKISTELNVSCPSKMKSYPVGTIFASKHINFSSTKKYYSVRSLLPLVDITDKSALEEYTKKYGSEETETTEKVKEEKVVEKEDTFLSGILSDKSLKEPTPSKDGFYMAGNDWRLLVRNVKKNINTMIIGPTGSGKTSCIKLLCDKLGKKLHVFDMGSMMDPISSLLGVHRLEKGDSIFDYAKFTQVIQEPCVILLDELSRAPLSTMNILFPCLDDRRSLSIEVASGKGVRDIKVHPDVTFIATANIGAEYSGTNTLDRALVNRFFPIELGYIPQEEEIKVLMKRCNIKKECATLIVKVANNVRSLSKKQEISVSLSIRETLMVSNLVSDGWSLGTAMETIFLPIFEGTKDEGERSTIYKIISSY